MTASALSACGPSLPGEEAVKNVAVATVGGRDVVIIESLETRRLENGSTRSIDRLILDGHTFLPVERFEVGMDYGAPGWIGPWIIPRIWHVKFSNEFIPAASLPRDFFDPVSIGYVESDPEDTLAAAFSFPVYWLSREFEPGTGLPALTLRTAVASGVTLPATGGLALTYTTVGGEKDSPALVLGVSEECASRGARFPNWADRCGTRRAIELPGGYATIFLGFEQETLLAQPLTEDWERACPPPPYDRFYARAHFGNTTVSVEAPKVAHYRGEYEDSPYDSVEGMEAVLRGLKLRQ